MINKYTKIAILPGKFDPINKGHVDIINRSLKIFKKIIIAILYHKKIKTFFSIKKRILLVKKVFEKNRNVKIKILNTMLIKFAKTHGVYYIIRGIRNTKDLNYELYLAENNRICKNIETIFFTSKKKYMFISSSIIRNILIFNGNVQKLIPKKINKLIYKK